jgi:Rrf2 family cysteine metabolism transcriptional repressor
VRLSTKGEYGLLALVDLAIHGGEGSVQAAEIAERQGIPKQYLDQLLVMAKRAGLVDSMRGRQGGYRLARPADSITLLDAVRVLEGPVNNANFAGRAARRKNACHAALKAVWDNLNSQTVELLKHKTIEDIADECKRGGDIGMYYI